MNNKKFRAHGAELWVFEKKFFFRPAAKTLEAEKKNQNVLSEPNQIRFRC